MVSDLKSKVVNLYCSHHTYISMYLHTHIGNTSNKIDACEMNTPEIGEAGNVIAARSAESGKVT